ncbi:uncharacterized protein LOC144987951 [Oryzias latipes]
MSSEPQEGSVREQLSAAEGTIVQNEEELCRQRRLLDSSWNPQLQLHIVVLPQHWMTEEEDPCNQQRNFRVEQEEPEPTQIKEEQEEPEPQQIKEEQQSFNVTDSQDEEGNQHEESTSTTDEETDPQKRDQRKRRGGSHVQSVDSSHMSAASRRFQHHHPDSSHCMFSFKPTRAPTKSLGRNQENPENGGGDLRISAERTCGEKTDVKCTESSDRVLMRDTLHVSSRTDV